MSILTKLQAVLDAAVSRGECAGISLLVMKGGREALYLDAGHADKETNAPLRRDHIFRLYSQTKPITAAAAMLLMERGQIDLMDAVENYLPGFRGQKVLAGGESVPANRPVWIMDLLGMTAGLCYPDADEAGQTAAALFAEDHRQIKQGGGMSTYEFCNRMGQLPLAFQPGSHWRYSTCADVLGAVIEVASGMPLDQFLRREFFEPLNMTDTDFYVPQEKKNRFVTCYRRTENGVVPFGDLHLAVGDYSRRPAFLSGGAGLVSTIDDYAAFARMLLCGGEYNGRRILSPETVRFMTLPQLSNICRLDMWDSLAGYSYGKLLRICMEPGRFPGAARQGEYGWDGWLGSYFANFPAQDMTILSMQNTTDTGTAPVMRKLRSMLLAADSLGQI